MKLVDGLEPGPLLLRWEVAAILRVKASTVTKWAKAGKLHPIVTPGGSRRYRKWEVDALLRGEVWEPPAVDAA
jgi:excisionase family DNA binding protein